MHPMQTSTIQVFSSFLTEVAFLSSHGIRGQMGLSTSRRIRMTSAKPRLICNCDSLQLRREPSPSPWTWTVRSTPCLSKSTAPWCSGQPKTGGSRPAHDHGKSPWAAPTTRTSLRSCRWAPLYSRHTLELLRSHT